MGFEPSARLLVLIKRVQMIKIHYPPGFDVLAERVMNLHHCTPLINEIAALS